MNGPHPAFLSGKAGCELSRLLLAARLAAVRAKLGRRMDDLSQLFYRGQFASLVEKTLETPGVTWPRSRAHYVIGALAFLGRIDDALVYFKMHRGDFDATGLAAARFFCGIALIRVLRYDEGLKFLRDNLLMMRREQPSATARFYIFQGLAFGRFFQCRFGLALRSAKVAWESALEADYAYGQTLAADLRAHLLVRTGAVSAGLTAFDTVARLVKRFGFGGTADSVATAQFYYRAQYGLLGPDTIKELEKHLKSFDPEDNFSLAAGQMGLAHQLALRGQLHRSEALLAQAARVLLKGGHRGHKVTMFHKLAHNRYYMGRYDEARGFLEKGEAELDKRFDLDQWLEIAGLGWKIARRLGDQAAMADLEGLIRRLSERVGSGLARNILWREFGAGTPTLRGDDVLGDVRHWCRHGEATLYADVLRIVASGYHGFLHEILPPAAERRAICFDLMPQRITVIDEGEITIEDEPVSGALKAVALQIARVPATKKDLIETHWGFVYHALRHDPLVYALINRLRKALGPAGSWLQFGDGAYGFLPGVRVFTYEPQGLATDLPQPPKLDMPQAKHLDPALTSDDTQLNHRQLAILTELSRRTSINVQDCVQLFAISRITAFRDLGELARRGLLRRHGRGRATSYHLNRGQARVLSP